MSKKTLNIGVSSLDDGLAQFAKVWKDASAGKHIKTFAGVTDAFWISPSCDTKNTAIPQLTFNIISSLTEPK